MPYTSPYGKDLFGLEAEDLAKDASILFERMHTEDLTKVQDSINRSARDFIRWEEEFRFVHPTKGEIWIRGTSVPIKESSGGVLWYGFASDITEEKKVQITMRAKDEQYRMLAENMTDTVWLMDMSQKPVYQSPSVSRMSGYPADEVIPLEQRVTHESLARLGKIYMEIGRVKNIKDLKQNQFREELEIVRKDGSRYWSDQTYTIIADSSGKPINILGTGRDITEMKLVELEIKKRVNELEVLYESGMAVSGIFEPELVGDKIIQILGEYLDWKHIVIRLYNPENNILELISFSHPGQKKRIARMKEFI